MAQVNVAIAKAGGKERLVHGRVGGSYFYFVNVGEHGVLSEAIMVSRVSEYTVEEWLDKLRVARVEESLNPRQD